MPYDGEFDPEDQDDACDLDPGKICDSCCKCIEVKQDYIEIPVELDVPQEAETFRSKPRRRH